MAKLVQCRTFDGQLVEYVDEIIGSGAMKDVYFSPDRSYVVAFFKTPQDAQAKDRLQMITGKYRDSLFNQTGGDYWKNLFCWPSAALEYEGKLGLVAPAYPAHFSWSSAPKAATPWASRAGKKRVNGSPRPATAAASWIRASWATGSITSRWAC